VRCIAVRLPPPTAQVEPTFGNRDPETITFLDVQAWISEREGTLTPAALRNYLGTLRQVQLSTTLDTYTHVLAGAEVPDEALNALLVWSRRGLDSPAS